MHTHIWNASYFFPLSLPFPRPASRVARLSPVIIPLFAFLLFLLPFFFRYIFPFPTDEFIGNRSNKDILLFRFVASVSRSFLFETIATVSKYTGAKQGCADKHSEDRQGS